MEDQILNYVERDVIPFILELSKINKHLETNAEEIFKSDSLAQFIPLLYKYYSNLLRNQYYFNFLQNYYWRSMESMQNAIKSTFDIQLNIIDAFQDHNLFDEIEVVISKYKNLVEKESEFKEVFDQIFTNEISALQEHFTALKELNEEKLFTDRPVLSDVEEAMNILWPISVHNTLFESCGNIENTLHNQPNSFTLNLQGFEELKANISIPNIEQWRNQNGSKKEFDEFFNSNWNEHYNKIKPRLQEVRQLYEIEKELLVQLQQFDPEFQVFLPRLADLIGQEQELTEKALKFTLAEYSGLGVYNDLAQVFKPTDKISEHIDKLLEQYEQLEWIKSGKNTE